MSGVCLTVDLPAGGGGEDAVPRAHANEPRWVPPACPCDDGVVPMGLVGSLQCWQDLPAYSTGAHTLRKMCIVLLVLSGPGLRIGASPKAGKSPDPWAGLGQGGSGMGEAGWGLGAGSSAG